MLWLSAIAAIGPPRLARQFSRLLMKRQKSSTPIAGRQAIMAYSVSTTAGCTEPQPPITIDLNPNDAENPLYDVQVFSNFHPRRSEGDKPMNVQNEKILYWLKGQSIQNFGDYLTEYIHQYVVDRIHIEAAAYHFIGSVISDDHIRNDLRSASAFDSGKVIFWGCGAREDRPLHPECLPKAEFFAVRGPLTRDLLGLPESTILGDPALLLPLFHKPEISKLTYRKKICVPHYFNNKSDDEVAHASGADFVLRPKIENNLDALKQIIDHIASADLVLAGSLHAAIVACAYNRPFCYYDDGHVDIVFKWRDFAASIGIRAMFVDNVQDASSVYSQFIGPRLRKPALFPLLAVAPFIPKSSMLIAAARHDSSQSMDEMTFVKLMASLDHLFESSAHALAREQAVADTERQKEEKLCKIATLETRLHEAEGELLDVRKQLKEKQALEIGAARSRELEALLTAAQSKLAATERILYDKAQEITSLEAELTTLRSLESHLSSTESKTEETNQGASDSSLTHQDESA